MKYLLLIFLTLNLDYSWGLNTEFIKNEIKQYKENPSQYYYKKTTKKFNKEEVIFDIQQKLNERQKLITSQNNSNKSDMAHNDLPENLLKGFHIERNIKKLNSLNIQEKKLETQPWSDDYWPIYKGVLGARYAVEEFEFATNWLELKNYITHDHASLIFDSQDSLKLDKLSPSEKYDLLLGQEAFSLTKKMWKQGQRYYESSEDGYIETWMGICHGWAPASYMLERPKKSIKVKSFDNSTEIKFYPADIKALASLLWASTSFQTNFVGGRCNTRAPQGDENGRVTTRDCLDNNPATLHLSLLNGVGRYGKSFVMDVTYDYEVWNQPVVSYSYRYFNPMNSEEKLGFEDSLVELSEYKDDPYQKYRSKKAKYIVGVAIEIEYGVETKPIQRDIDNESFDRLNRVLYLYDLELDKNFNIIGGEWYNRDHPDFLWTPDYQSQALASGDYYLLSRELWDGKKSLPKDIKNLANKAGKNGSPLAYIINSLIKIAQ